MVGLVLAGRQGSQGYLPEEPQGCPRLYQPARVEQHSAAGKRSSGAPKAAPVLAGLVQRGDGRIDPPWPPPCITILTPQRRPDGKQRAIGDDMSRVHDALRRAEQGGLPVRKQPPSARGGRSRCPSPRRPRAPRRPCAPNLQPAAIGEAPVVPFQPAPESHLLDLNNSHETPAEEFRTLRTRLNHLQTLQPLHTVMVTSPSPAEGKTFAAVNLALAQAHLAENSRAAGRFRSSPARSSTTCSRSTARPGLSDYLSGQCTLPRGPAPRSRASTST